MGRKDQSEATNVDQQGSVSSPIASGAMSVATGAASAAAPTIDQVRELLFGETKRTTEQHLASIEARIDELVADTLRRFAELERKTMEMDQAAEERRASSVDMIGSAMVDLGNLIRSRAQ